MVYRSCCLMGRTFVSRTHRGIWNGSEGIADFVPAPLLHVVR